MFIYIPSSELYFYTCSIYINITAPIFFFLLFGNISQKAVRFQNMKL